MVPISLELAGRIAKAVGNALTPEQMQVILDGSLIDRQAVLGDLAPREWLRRKEMDKSKNLNE